MAICSAKRQLPLPSFEGIEHETGLGCWVAAHRRAESHVLQLINSGDFIPFATAARKKELRVAVPGRTDPKSPGQEPPYERKSRLFPTDRIRSRFQNVASGRIRETHPRS